jgi:hypothetical protein
MREFLMRKRKHSLEKSADTTGATLSTSTNI